MPQHKSGKKGRKVGRNAAKCKQYRDQNRRERNKARKQRRILKGFRTPEEREKKKAA